MRDLDIAELEAVSAGYWEAYFPTIAGVVDLDSEFGDWEDPNMVFEEGLEMAFVEEGQNLYGFYGIDNPYTATFDESLAYVGGTDANGNVYDGNGGYFAPNGNYYYWDGTYIAPNGDIHNPDGSWEDVSTGDYHYADGSWYEASTGNTYYTDGSWLEGGTGWPNGGTQNLHHANGDISYGNGMFYSADNGALYEPREVSYVDWETMSIMSETFLVDNAGLGLDGIPPPPPASPLQMQMLGGMEEALPTEEELLESWVMLNYGSWYEYEEYLADIMWAKFDAFFESYNQIPEDLYDYYDVSIYYDENGHILGVEQRWLGNAAFDPDLPNLVGYDPTHDYFALGYIPAEAFTNATQSYDWLVPYDGGYYFNVETNQLLIDIDVIQPGYHEELGLHIAEDGSVYDAITGAYYRPDGTAHLNGKEYAKDENGNYVDVTGLGMVIAGTPAEYRVVDAGHTFASGTPGTVDDGEAKSSDGKIIVEQTGVELNEEGNPIAFLRDFQLNNPTTTGGVFLQLVIVYNGQTPVKLMFETGTEWVVNAGASGVDTLANVVTASGPNHGTSGNNTEYGDDLVLAVSGQTVTTNLFFFDNWSLTNLMSAVAAITNGDINDWAVGTNSTLMELVITPSTEIYDAYLTSLTSSAGPPAVSTFNFIVDP